jgi:hypothetical protein
LDQFRGFGLTTPTFRKLNTEGSTGHRTPEGRAEMKM